MSNFKFTPKRGVIANVQQFVRASTATAALTAANGLEAARFLNKSQSLKDQGKSRTLDSLAFARRQSFSLRKH